MLKQRKYKLGEFKPAERRPIERGQLTRCFNCHRKLKSGLAYYVTDPQGEVLPAGPNCFEKATGLKASAEPNLAIHNTRPHGIAQAERVARDFRKVVDMPKIRRREAQENLKLRGVTLWTRGFEHMRQEEFQPYLKDYNDLSDGQIEAINSRAAELEKFDARHGLPQLKACLMHYAQIKSLLRYEGAKPEAHKVLRKLQEALFEFHGLQTLDAARLQKYAAKAEKEYGVRNLIGAVPFPVGMNRYQPLRFEPPPAPPAVQMNLPIRVSPHHGGCA